MSARRNVKRGGPACGVNGDASGLVSVGFVEAGEVSFPLVLGKALGGFGDLGKGEAVFLSKACVDSVVCGEVSTVGVRVGVVQGFNKVVVGLGLLCEVVVLW